MAASVNFSPGNVRVRGGDKIDQFIRDVLKGAYLLQVIEEFVKTFPMGALKADTPRNTGRLAESLRLERRGYTVELRGEFYGTFHKIVEQRFLELAGETLRRIL